MTHYNLLIGAGGKTVVGQEAYTTPGTYSWVAPSGVTSVCVVCVGGGGGGGGQSNDSRNTPGCNGGSGAVRIIWGRDRAFPDTDTADII